MKRPLAAAAVTVAVAAALVPILTSPTVDAPDAAIAPGYESEVEPGSEAERGAEEGEPMGAALPKNDLASSPRPVKVAVSNFADLRGVTADEIVIRKVEAVTWNDASLGCAKQDSMYLQVLTPGFRVTLESDGEEAIYHTNASDQAVRCDSSSDLGIYEFEGKSND